MVRTPRRVRLAAAVLVATGPLLPAPDATAAPNCGRPDEAPGFETPTLQSAGFNEVDSTDAGGKGRRQFADRNWTVVGQRPDPGGERPKSTRISLGVVKDGESRSCR